MKRSRINRAIDEAIQVFRDYKFHLPQWAYWTAKEWKEAGAEAEEIRSHQLGWIVTDFGSGDFDKVGLLIFVVRNGCLEHNQPKTSKTYAEKFMAVRPGQVTPYHFHWCKTEDLINRSGGRLAVELAWANDDEQSLSDKPVTVQVDGITRNLHPRQQLVLQPGESVTFPPRLCHQFYGYPDDGTVLAGEVSSLNDDSMDNCFLGKPFRRTPIEEDESIKYLLNSDYTIPADTR
jgi:D-lyxose ketol-isomerase